MDCSCYPNSLKRIECTVFCHCCARNDNDDNLVLDRKLAKQKMKKMIARNEFYNFFHSVLPIVISSTFVNSIIGGVGDEQSNSLIHLVCGNNESVESILQILFMILVYFLGLYFYTHTEDLLVRNFLKKDTDVSSSDSLIMKTVNFIKFKTAKCDEHTAYLLLYLQRLVASIAGFTIKSVVVVLLFRVFYYRNSEQLGATFGMYCVFLVVINGILLFSYYVIGQNLIKNTIEFNSEAFSLAIGFSLMLFFSLAAEFPCGEYLYYWKHDQESFHNIQCSGYSWSTNIAFAILLSLLFTGMKLGFHYCFHSHSHDAHSQGKVESSSANGSESISSSPSPAASIINREDDAGSRVSSINTLYSELIETTLCYILSIAFLGSIFTVISGAEDGAKLILLIIIISYVLIKIPRSIAGCNVRMLQYKDNISDSTCKCCVSTKQDITTLCCPLKLQQLYDELIKERSHIMVTVFRLFVGLLFEDFIIIIIILLFGEENMRNQAGGCTFELVVSILLFVFGIYYTPVIYDKQATLQQEIVDNPLFNNLSTTKLLALHKTREASDSASSNNL